MRTHRLFIVHLLAAACFTLAGFCVITEAEDWPNWRGPNYNGLSDEKNWNPLKIKDGVKEFANRAPQHDDITIIVMEVK